MGSAIDKFLSLRCAGDVLESLQPLTGDLEPRFAEAMIIVNAIRPLVLKNKGSYKIIELCAGRPIASSIIAHLLPVEHVTAFCWRGGPENMPGIQKVQHLKCSTINPKLTLSAFEREARMPNTIVIAGSPNSQVALHVAAHCGKYNIPMAIVPGYAKIRLNQIARQRAVAYDGSNEHVSDYANYLGYVSGGKVKYLRAYPYCNDVLVTQGI